jgi:hypothetical protein
MVSDWQALDHPAGYALVCCLQGIEDAPGMPLCLSFLDYSPVSVIKTLFGHVLCVLLAFCEFTYFTTLPSDDDVSCSRGEFRSPHCFPACFETHSSPSPFSVLAHDRLRMMTEATGSV